MTDTQTNEEEFLRNLFEQDWIRFGKDSGIVRTLIALTADRLFPGRGWHEKADSHSFRLSGEALSAGSPSSGSAILQGRKEEAPHSPAPSSCPPETFQKEALDLSGAYFLLREFPREAEVFLLAERAEKLLGRLFGAFERTFMNYTEKEPGHWVDPEEGSRKGFLDSPCHGSLLCLAFASAEIHAPGKDLRCRQYLQQYHEFLGAVFPALTPGDLAFALPAAVLAAKLFPEETHFRILAEAFAEKFLKEKEEKTEKGAENGEPDHSVSAAAAIAISFLTGNPETYHDWEKRLFLRISSAGFAPAADGCGCTTAAVQGSSLFPESLCAVMGRKLFFGKAVPAEALFFSAIPGDFPLL